MQVVQIYPYVLALASLNKHTEAVNYYKKALELDPDNDTYKSNLKIAEQKMKELPSPASSLMTNPQVQQLMSGMMSGSYGPMGATGAGAGAGPGPGVGVGVGRGGAGPGGAGPNDLSGLIQAGQQFAQQMQQENPELIEQLRSQIRSRPPSASNEEQP
ncbi:UNVERIFIED_CONTAM: hypothetical protein FKN15_001765 [Acipenser sinensis]